MHRHAENFKSWAGLTAAATIMAGLTGCVTMQNVPIEDGNSPSFAVRGTIRPKAWALDPSKPGAGIEVGYEGYRATDTQTLSAGQSIRLVGSEINGPDTLHHEATLQQVHVAYNHLIRFGSSFQLEPFVGATRVHLKIKSDSAAGAGARGLNDWRTGVMGGVTPRWRFNDTWAVETRLSFFDAADLTSGRSYELAVVWSATPNASLRLGYSDRRYDVNPDTYGLYSEVNVRARGPLATLQFSF